MIRQALFFWLAFSAMAAAAPVKVETGEHPGFTRVVLDFGHPVTWQVGRTARGYGLRLDGEAPEYDTTESFERLSAKRITALSVDPDTHVLTLGVSCACYAIPYEFREGIVVIDLRDGAAPQGSSFEAALLPSEAPPPPLPAPASTSYSWQATALAEIGAAPQRQEVPEAIVDEADPRLAALRDDLINQLSRGASQGVIDLVPLNPPKPATGEVPATDQASTRPETRVVRAPPRNASQLSVTQGQSDHPDIGSQGEVCVAAEALDLASWRGEGEVSDTIHRVTQDLIGEFDRADPAALARAVRFYLAIGFGKEAQQLLRAFPSDLPEQDLWQALGDLVDGVPDPQGVFSGQMGCNTPAALWALLANPEVEEGDLVNKGAAYLAFSNLPIDLRRSLGPELVGRFLAMGDEDSAASIRDAILRAPGAAGPQVAVMEAVLDMNGGAPALAEQKLQAVVEDSGPSSTEALVGLIEARAAQNSPVEPDMVEVLGGLAQETTHSDQGHRVARALTIAQAASGDFDAAFANPAATGEVVPILWRLLAQLGSDDALLSHAILPPAEPLPRVEPATRTKLVSRLFDLDMADMARRWVDDEAGFDPLLLARIDLQRHDGGSALRILGAVEGGEALPLRAEALRQLGDEAAAARVYSALGDSASASQSQARAQDWQGLGATGEAGWKAAAETLQPPALPDGAPTMADAPLAYGQRLLDHSSATRSAVEALLQQVAQP